MIYSVSPLIAVLFLLLSFLSPSPANAQLDRISELAQKAGPAVVNISTVKLVSRSGQIREFFRDHGEDTPFEDFFDQFEQYFGQDQEKPREESSLGSGFIISDDGYVVTNNHVIDEAREISVKLQGVDDAYEAEVIGRDPETDLALLKIEADHSLPVLKFGNSNQLRVGEWVVAIGNPFGLDHTVTTGIISAKGRSIGTGPFDDFLQTDASINPGNSGGPLLNLDGEVVGINTAIIATGHGIGFAIPGSMAKTVIAQLREHQEVRRGWIGVTIQNIDENTAKALDLDEPKGALVASVLPGQPAEEAGLRTGDAILAVNDEQVADSGELTRAIAGLQPGETARLVVWRKGRKKNIEVTLGQRDLDKVAESASPAPERSETALGLTVRPVRQDEAEALGLEAPRGLLVTAVQEESPAAKGDIREGDVILQLNQQDVDTVDTFTEIAEAEGTDKVVLLVLVLRSGQNIFRTIKLPGE